MKVDTAQAHFFSKALCGTLLFQQVHIELYQTFLVWSLDATHNFARQPCCVCRFRVIFPCKQFSGVLGNATGCWQDLCRCAGDHLVRLSTAGFPLPENEIIEESSASGGLKGCQMEAKGKRIANDFRSIDEPGQSSPASTWQISSLTVALHDFWNCPQVSGRWSRARILGLGLIKASQFEADQFISKAAEKMAAWCRQRHSGCMVKYCMVSGLKYFNHVELEWNRNCQFRFDPVGDRGIQHPNAPLFAVPIACRYFRSLNTSEGSNGEDLLLVDCKTPMSNERTAWPQEQGTASRHKLCQELCQNRFKIWRFHSFRSCGGSAPL